MFIVLLFAIPMYLCATGSIPIAVALMLKGLSPGTALVLLMAGPAVNIASLLVIGKVMGKKSLLTYLISIISCAILFGLGIDHLLPREWFITPLAQIHACHDCDISYFSTICTAILALLLANAFIQRYLNKKESSCSCHACSTTTLSITIKGMNCNHCKSNAEASISKVTGVESVEIDLTTGKATIHGNPNREEVINAVEKLGFTVEE